MTRHLLTLAVTGQLGPYSVLTEEAVRGLAEKIGDGSQIPVRLPDDRLVLGTVVGDSVVDEIAPGRFALHADVDIDDALEPPALHDLSVAPDVESDR